MTRPPPHNLEAEWRLLGSMMRDQRTRDAALAALNPHDFYGVPHQQAFTVIETLAIEGKEADPITVADRIGKGEGPELATLIDWLADSPDRGTAATYVEIVRAAAAKRRILMLSLELTEAVYRGEDTSSYIDKLGRAEAGSHITGSTWAIVDLDPVLNGDLPEIRPVWLSRQDGQLMLYPGRIHAFNGESESGKSWLAHLAAYEAAAAGEMALYVDWEDHERLFVERMRDMGASDEEIRRIAYVRPSQPFDDQAAVFLTRLLQERRFAVAVLDGMAEALTLNAWDENSAKDVTEFYSRLPRRIAASGSSVVIIDHVVKDKEKQGRYGRGSTAKLNGVDGAVYKVEAIKPFGRGQTGQSRIVLMKDRIGWLRMAAEGQSIFAEMELASRADGPVVLALRKPKAKQMTDSGAWAPTVMMERVSKALQPLGAISANQLVTIVHGKQEYVKKAVDALVETGHVERTAGPRNSVVYRLLHPYQPEPEEDEGRRYPDYYQEEHD